MSFISPRDCRHIGLKNSKIMMYIWTRGLNNIMLIMCYVDKKSCCEKLFHHTQAIKISQNKIYEQNWSMLQTLTHSGRKGFRKLGVFCAWIQKLINQKMKYSYHWYTELNITHFKLITKLFVEMTHFDPWCFVIGYENWKSCFYN